MSIPVLRTRQGQPDAYRMTVTAPEGEDYSLITSAVFKVQKPDGAGGTLEVEWDATIIVKSTDSISIAHFFTLGELDRPGVWRLYAQFTVAGLTPGPASEPEAFLIKDPYET